MSDEYELKRIPVKHLIEALQRSLGGPLPNDMNSGSNTHMTREEWIDFCVWDWDNLHGYFIANKDARRDEWLEATEWGNPEDW